jgi:uncharacterized protein (DUF1330 family)
MNQRVALGLTLLAGIAIGATAIQGLHAQAKPPVYYIAENDVTNPEAYLKEYAPPQGDLIRASGGRYLAAGGKTTAFDGEAPKGRVVITAWDSLEKIQACILLPPSKNSGKSARSMQNSGVSPSRARRTRARSRKVSDFSDKIMLKNKDFGALSDST